MDSDPRMNGGTVVNGMTAKVEMCKFFAKRSCKQSNDCSFLHEAKKKIPKGGGKGSGKRHNGSKDKCYNCGKVTVPPHRSKDFPEPRKLHYLRRLPR